MTYAHGLPQVVVFEQLVPIPADPRGAREGTWVVYEAENVQGYLRGQRAEEVALEERSNSRGEEEQLGRCTFLDERVEMLPSRRRREASKMRDMGDG